MNGDSRRADTVLVRHWPAFILALLFVLLVVVWFLTTGHSAPGSASSGVRLLQSTIPNLLAVVVVALALYVLLRIDVTRDRVPIGLRTEPAFELNAIEQQLATIAVAVDAPVLRSRSQLPSLDALVENAHNVAIVATSGLGLINHHYGLFQDLLQRNTELRVVLLDPDVPEAVAIWDRQSNPPMSHPERDIRQGIDLFRQLEGHDRRCRVLLTDVVIPYSLVCAFDGLGGGTIQAEFNLFQSATDRRPHVLVASSDGNPWFSLFREQLDTCIRRAEEHSNAIGQALNRDA